MGIVMAPPGAYPIQAAVQAAGLAPGPLASSLAPDAWMRALGGLPLLHQPGEGWTYHTSAEALGVLIARAADQSLGTFLHERIFAPLGMRDTGFTIPEDQLHRAATLYEADADGKAMPRASRSMAQRPPVLSGSGGLLSTAADFHRFLEVLRQRGEHDGVRLLAPRTMDLLAANHLPEGTDLATFSLWQPEEFAGIGFGFGVQVTLDPVRRKLAGSAGEFGWAGAASTVFFVDPAADMTVQFLTQLQSPNRIPSELRQLVYQALVH
jgi:CubicO group peptidase (beta-lactamase class C family)